MSEARRAGRPALQPEDRKEEVITIRMTAEMREQLEALARDRGFDDISKLTRALYDQALKPAHRLTWGRR